MGKRTKKNAKSGFTLIEVILFLAISSAILVVILSGTSNTLAQQRYNDTVQDVFSFLQSQYSSVISPRNTSDFTSNPGFSDRAIYGKLIVFDRDELSDSGGSVINSWTIVGKVVTKETKNLDFNDLDLKVKCDEKNSYSVQWGGTIETTSSSHTRLNATIAILRSPKNGTIYTFQRSGVEVKSSNCTSNEKVFIPPSGFAASFTTNNTDICIATEDHAYGGKRRNIRIMNSNSINSINLIPLDIGSENKCQ